MSLAGARVMVTGGAGFIGGHLVEALVAAGSDVVVFDNFSTGLRDNLARVADKIEIIPGDILDRGHLETAMRGCDLVSHQAAQLEITTALADPSVDLRVNTLGSINVMEAAATAGVRRVVSASSACIYGQPVDIPTTEQSPPMPNWEYGISKLAAEHYGRIISARSGVEIVHLRYGIVYGEREWFGRALTLFLARVVDGEPPVVFGSGHQVRDFVHVSDVVACNLAALSHPAAAGQAFNVSTGAGTSIRAIAELVCEIDGTGLSPVTEDVAEGATSQLIPGRRRLPAELGAMLLSPAKAHALLGWTPMVQLSDGVGRELRWLRHHRERWQTMSY